MATKRLFVLILILSIASISSGCVSRNRFDQAITELSAAQSQQKTLEVDFAALQSKYESLQADHAALQSNFVALTSEHEASQVNLDDARADLDDARDNLESTQAQLDTALSDLEQARRQMTALQEKTDKAKTKIKLLSRMFLPILTGEAEKYTDAQALGLFLEWGNLVEEIDDATLQDKFDALMSGDFGQKEVDDFFIYLIEGISKSLE